MKERMIMRHKARNITLGIVAGGSLIAGTIYAIGVEKVGEYLKSEFNSQQYCDSKKTPEEIKKCIGETERAMGAGMHW